MRHIFSKYGFLIIVAAACLTGPRAHAQNSEQKTSVLSVTATIMPEIQIKTIRDINLDDLDIVDEMVRISPIQDPQAGLMIASGQPNAKIRMTYIKELVINQVDGSGRLLFNYEVSIFSQDNQQASRLFETIDDELKFNDQGKMYIWVGGTVDLKNALPGEYDGEFTIEIEYF
jgi:hypothetical protein